MAARVLRSTWSLHIAASELPDANASDNAVRLKRDPTTTVRTGLLAAILILAPIEIWRPIMDTGHPTVSLYYRWVSTFVPLDVIWLAFVVVSIPVVIMRSRTRQWSVGLVTVTAFALWAGMSLAITPSALGLAFLSRWIGSIALVAVIGSYRPRELRWFVAAPLLVSGAIQSAMALWQSPGPGEDFLYGGLGVGVGTYTHPAGLALLLGLVVSIGVVTLPGKQGRLFWILGIALATTAAAGTLSRTGALALGAIWLCYLWGAMQRPRQYIPVLAASILPFIISVAVHYSGWFQRVADTTTGSLNQRTSGRVALIQDAIAMIGDHPLFGVGPGSYIAEASRLHPTWSGWELIPVHVTPLIAAVELGIVGGLIIAGIFGYFGWRSFRTSPATLALFVSIGVFLVFEQRTHYIPADVALFAVWIATLDVLIRNPAFADPESSKLLRRPRTAPIQS